MSALDRFDRDLGPALADLAGPRTPDYIDDVLARAVSRRQRPGWTFPERWLPMGVLARRPAFVPALAWRTIGMLIILALLLAALFTIGVGALLQRTAPPYGLAGNGVVGYSVDGDIYARDLSTGSVTRLVGGPSVDVEPLFSRDGIRFAFTRLTSQEPETIEVLVANADGSNVRTVVEPEPLGEWRWLEWSPRGDQLVIHTSAGGVSLLSVVNVDGKPDRRAIEVPLEVMAFDWRPGSDELIFSARERETAPDAAWGLYAVKVDGTDLRELLPPPISGYHDGEFALSHDGRFLAYNYLSADDSLGIHILDIDSGEVRRLGGRGPQGFPVFSPDGQKLAFIRYSEPDETEVTAQVFVASALGDGADAIPYGPAVRDSLHRGLLAQFSPDGTSLLIRKSWRGPRLRNTFTDYEAWNTFTDDEAWLVDLYTGGHKEVTLGDDEWLNWQRLAP